MRQLRAVWKRLQNQLAARGLDRDFGDELDTLFAMHLEENRRAGDHDTFPIGKQHEPDGRENDLGPGDLREMSRLPRE